MITDTLNLHLTQVERRFRRINAKLRQLFNLYRLIVRDDNPNKMHAHIRIIDEMNNLIQLMIIDTVIHLNLFKKRRQLAAQKMAPSNLDQNKLLTATGITLAKKLTQSDLDQNKLLTSGIQVKKI